MEEVREDSEVFTQPLGPATFLYNSWNKGQESIKQNPSWLRTRIWYLKIILNITSTEAQMNGITHARTIQCHTHFQSRMVHEIAFKYFNVIFGGMWHTLHYSMREIPLIWCLNRLIQTINIFVITVTIHKADCSPYWMDKGKGIHGKHQKQCISWEIYEILPQFSCISWYFPMFVLTRVVFHFHWDFFFPLWMLSLGGGLFTPQWAASMVPNWKSAIFPSLCPVWMDTLSPHLPSPWKKKGLNPSPCFNHGSSGGL